MASLQDVADQINAKLDAINTNTATTAARTTELRDLSVTANSILGSIRSELANGFTNLSQGLFAVLEVQRAALQLLDHHREQNDTIICQLKAADDLLCGITRKFTRQLELSESIDDSIGRIEEITERVHPGEAADADRHAALAAAMGECCPEDPAPIEPCPEACKEPQFDPRRPDGQKWSPLKSQREPIG